MLNAVVLWLSVVLWLHAVVLWLHAVVLWLHADVLIIDIAVYRGGQQWLGSPTKRKPFGQEETQGGHGECDGGQLLWRWHDTHLEPATGNIDQGGECRGQDDTAQVVGGRG